MRVADDKAEKLGLAIEASIKGAPKYTTTINFRIIGGVTHTRCFFIPAAGERHIKPTANIVIPNEVFAERCSQYLTRINKRP